MPIRLVLVFLGGGERDRTDDPLLAKQVLSQLSYTPVERVRMRGSRIGFKPSPSAFTCPQCLQLVGLVGVEPTTPALSRRCSNQLSYRPQILKGLGLRGQGLDVSLVPHPSPLLFTNNR
jgi:hypothetical protein